MFGHGHGVHWDVLRHGRPSMGLPLVVVPVCLGPVRAPYVHRRTPNKEWAGWQVAWPCPHPMGHTLHTKLRTLDGLHPSAMPQ